jgi:hypothetical protein
MKFRRHRKNDKDLKKNFQNRNIFSGTNHAGNNNHLRNSNEKRRKEFPIFSPIVLFIDLEIRVLLFFGRETVDRMGPGKSQGHTHIGVLFING